MSNLLLGSLDHCLTHHSIIGDMTFLYLQADHHSFHFLITLFCIPSPHSRFVIHILSISYILTHFWFDTFYTSFTCFIDRLNTYPFFLFHHRHFPQLPWVHGSRVLLYMSHYTQGHVFFIIGYLGLVSLHSYYPIALAYVTSCVLRPP